MNPIHESKQMKIRHSLRHAAPALVMLAKALEGLVEPLTEDGPKTTAIKIAWSYLGIPYRWGGDDPIEGFDCSGFIVEILQGVGVISDRKDFTANGLWNLFSERTCGVERPYEGCLVFWMRESPQPGIQAPPHAKHVELCLNKELCIGASGGSSQVVTELDAVQKNACVKIRPIRNRSGTTRFVDPFMRSI